MGNNTNGLLESFWERNVGFVDGVFEVFKRLFMNWLRFYRANMECPCGLCINRDCPTFCPLDEEMDCPELERIWNLWLATLGEDDRAILN
jgi:hypothetical protein